MHVIFIPYGIKSALDVFYNELQCQKYNLKMWKPGESDKVIPMQGSLRILPFGVVEYIFPREYLDLVLTTLRFHGKTYPQYQGFKLNTALRFLRTFLMAEKAPETFKTDQKLLWMMEHVAIIPIGIRDDANITEPEGAVYPGWIHEAI